MEEFMFSLSLALLGMEALLFKYGAISLLDTINASTVFATLAGLIDLAIKFILEGFKGI
jgi:hypothetical protein